MDHSRGAVFGVLVAAFSVLLAAAPAVTQACPPLETRSEVFGTSLASRR